MYACYQEVSEIAFNVIHRQSGLLISYWGQEGINHIAIILKHTRCRVPTEETQSFKKQIFEGMITFSFKYIVQIKTEIFVKMYCLRLPSELENIMAIFSRLDRYT